MKITPETEPMAAVPTASTPACESVMPDGRRDPAASIPNMPPRATPAGSVVARSNVAPLPTMRAGTYGAQAAGAGAGADGGAGAGVGAGAVPSGEAASLPPPQPAKALAATAIPLFRRCLRSSLTCIGLKTSIPLQCRMRLSHVGVCPADRACRRGLKSC